jgi:hypothetical protein
VFEQLAEPAKVTKRRGRSVKAAKALVNIQVTRQNNQAKETNSKPKASKALVYDEGF